MKRLLINGGCGFLGSNLASYGIANGYDVTVSTTCRGWEVQEPGMAENSREL